MRCILVIGFVAWAAMPLGADQSQKRDGNWWNDATASTRAVYVLGIMDGVELGYQFSTWGLPKIDDPSKPDPVFGAVYRSYSSYLDDYLSDVTVGMISDGLNEFYKDYRNRLIVVKDAYWWVLRSIHGTPAEELEQHVLNLRKNAAKK